MAEFIALVSHTGPIPPSFAERPAPDPAMFGLPTQDDGSRSDPLLGQNMISCSHYRLDFDALRAAPTHIVIGVGIASRQMLAGRAALAVAERLGTTAITFPGGHDGFIGAGSGRTGDPDAFAATLRTILAEEAAHSWPAGRAREVATAGPARSRDVPNDLGHVTRRPSTATLPAPTTGPPKVLARAASGCTTGSSAGLWSYAEGTHGEATGADKEYLESAFADLGAVIGGRWTYEAAEHWGGHNPWRVPFFIVTHRPDEEPSGAGFTFVDGLDEAIRRAQAAAGEKDVQVMGGADLIRQALRAGYVDEFTLTIAPVVLGAGKRLFRRLRRGRTVRARAGAPVAVRHAHHVPRPPLADLHRLRGT